jgi:hypothetical protein
MVLVDTMVKQSEKKLSDSAATLQAILAAAADENGEWYLPLSQQQVCVCGGVGVGGAGRGQRPAAAWWSSAWRTPWAGPWRRRCSRLAPKRRRGQSGSWDQPEAALGPALLDGGCLGAGGAAGGEGAAGGGAGRRWNTLGRLARPAAACPHPAPAPRAQVATVRAALDRNAEALDEALLSNAFAYIKKASDDRFDSLVALLQKVKPVALTGPGSLTPPGLPGSPRPRPHPRPKPGTSPGPRPPPQPLTPPDPAALRGACAARPRDRGRRRLPQRAAVR